MHPQLETYSDHLKTRDQHITSVRLSMAEQQPLCEEDVLQMIQSNDDPDVHLVHVYLRVGQAVGMVYQALWKASPRRELSLLEASVASISAMCIGS